MMTLGIMTVEGHLFHLLDSITLHTTPLKVHYLIAYLPCSIYLILPQLPKLLWYPGSNFPPRPLLVLLAVNIEQHVTDNGSCCVCSVGLEPTDIALCCSMFT